MKQTNLLTGAMTNVHPFYYKKALFNMKARWFTLFQVEFSLLTAFSASLEGSVVEMKPAAPVPVDTVVSLKA